MTIFESGSTHSLFAIRLLICSFWFTDEAGLNGEDAAKLVRVNPELDHSTGFFVALFIRKGKAQKRTREESDVSAIRDGKDSTPTSAKKTKK